MDLGFIADEQPPPADPQLPATFEFLHQPHRAPPERALPAHSQPFLHNFDLAPQTTSSLAALLSTSNPAATAPAHPAAPPQALASSAPPTTPYAAARLPSLAIPPVAPQSRPVTSPIQLQAHQQSQSAAQQYSLPAIFSPTPPVLFEELPRTQPSPSFPHAAPPPPAGNSVDLTWSTPFNVPSSTALPEQAAAAHRAPRRSAAHSIQASAPLVEVSAGAINPSQAQDRHLRAALNLQRARSVRIQRPYSASLNHHARTTQAQYARAPASNLSLLNVPVSDPTPIPNPVMTASSTDNRKRQRVTKSEYAAVKEEKKPSPVVDDNDDNCCPICFEPWTSNGKHQLCCLTCGHLFGRSCIETWLKKRKVCPSCKVSMKGKKVFPIYGAPTRLAVVDNSIVENVRSELEKEKKEHSSTKRKLKDASRRLKQQSSVPSLGEPIGASSSVHNPLMFRSTVITNSGLQRTGTVIPLSRAAMAHSPRMLTSVNASHETLSGIPPSREAVRPMCILDTNGESKALAFDVEGNVLYSEKRVSGQIGGGAQKVSFRRLQNPNARSQCRIDFSGRINDIVVCRNLQSQYRGHVALVHQNKKLHVLNQTLEEAISYDTPGVPMSCWWMRSEPQILIAGLSNGLVCAYDIRMNGAEPLSSRKVQAPNCAVHSLTEVPIFRTNQEVVLAASPTRIDAVTFGSFASTMSMEQVYRSGPHAQEHCSSLAADGEQILVSSAIEGSNGIVGRHVVHQGIYASSSEDGQAGANASLGVSGIGRTLHFGPSLSRDGLVGHRMVFPLERSAIVRGDGFNADGIVVLSSDAYRMDRSTRIWEFARNSTGSGVWNSAQIAPYQARVGTVVMKSMTFTYEMNPEHSGRRLRAVAGHLGDSTLQLLGVARR